MKKYLLVVTILLYIQVSYAQEKELVHEIKLSYGMVVILSDDMDRGITGSYMYRVARWLWVGANINWQFSSDIEHYYLREYYTDKSFKDFDITKRTHFFAIAPELRLSYLNKKWTTLYSSLSAGYGVQTGVHKSEDTCLNITFLGGNWYLGSKQNFFVGGEVGVGFKGILILHAGYRF